MHCDLRIHARWIVPVEPTGVVHDNHALMVRDGRIAAILPGEIAAAEWPATEVVQLPDHVLIPGLVNGHVHAAMCLFRGLADDLPLATWLNDHIWPAEGRWVSPEFVAAGTRLAVAEMLRGGTTCMNDMYFHPDVAAEVASDAGMRAVLGLIVLDFPTPWGSGPDEYLAKARAVHGAIADDPLLSCTIAPHAPYTVSDQPMQRAFELAEELDLPFHIHVHETAKEVADGLSNGGGRPITRLDRLGVMSPRMVAVHMTQLDGDDISRVASSGAHVVHCPESNLKLASGLCPTQALLDAGVNVAIGTDGAASNNDLDLLGEMRIAAMLAKVVASDATAVDAATALRMATLGGARAIGLDRVVGSLEPGKAADIVALDLGGLDSQPVLSPLSNLVYATGRHQVSDVWVAGRRLLDGRRLTTIDEERVGREVREWGLRIANGG